MKKTLALFVCLFSIACSFASGDAFSVNRELGRGINLGNMFEAPSENAWGNPFRPEYPEMIAAKGFSHVRIPIRWETAERSQNEPPYTISPEFLDRIETVVEQSLAADLYVILNMHHHNSLFADPYGGKERFLAQWRQIADAFADQPETLVFEILNEPHGALTAPLWNDFAASALEVIREKNPTRPVVIGTAEWGGLNALDELVLPEDDNLILTIHYYLPFPFTHQGASWVDDPAVSGAAGIEWLGTEEEKAAVRAHLDRLKHFGKEHNVPVHIGEFGSYNRADIDSRARWTAFLARSAEERGFSWAYWEFSAGFGIYNPATGEWNQSLVEALVPPM